MGRATQIKKIILLQNVCKMRNFTKMALQLPPVPNVLFVIGASSM